MPTTTGTNMNGRTRAWRAFIGLNAAAVALFLVHLAEEAARGAMTTETWVLVGPVILALAIGTAYAYMRHLTGLGLALAADIWITIAVGYFHLVPGSPDFIGEINAAWGGGLVGFVMAAVALGLWVAGVAALAAGVWAVARLEPEPTHRVTAA